VGKISSVVVSLYQLMYIFHRVFIMHLLIFVVVLFEKDDDADAS
jgi:hypothetical protein